MGKPTGFMELKRETLEHEPIETRVTNFKEFEKRFHREDARKYRPRAAWIVASRFVTAIPVPVRAAGEIVELQRLHQRVIYDVEMMKEMGTAGASRTTAASWTAARRAAAPHAAGLLPRGLHPLHGRKPRGHRAAPRHVQLATAPGRPPSWTTASACPPPWTTGPCNSRSSRAG